jgi:hypothetical protein
LEETGPCRNDSQLAIGDLGVMILDLELYNCTGDSSALDEITEVDGRANSLFQIDLGNKSSYPFAFSDMSSMQSIRQFYTVRFGSSLDNQGHVVVT